MEHIIGMKILNSFNRSFKQLNRWTMNRNLQVVRRKKQAHTRTHLAIPCVITVNTWTFGCLNYYLIIISI